MFPVSAGDAERSGCKEGYDLLDEVLCERCSTTLLGDANCYFSEEEEVNGNTPRGHQRYGVLHGETQDRDRGNKEDSLQLEGCISMSPGVAVIRCLVVIDSVEEPKFEVPRGEISNVSPEEFDDHDVASGYRTNVDELEANLVTFYSV